MALWHYQQIIVELRRNSVSYVLASYFLQLLGLALQPNRSTASSQQELEPDWQSRLYTGN